MRVRDALIAGALAFSVFAGCASTSGGESTSGGGSDGISCAADAVCQPSCAADPDCETGGAAEAGALTDGGARDAAPGAADAGRVDGGARDAAPGAADAGRVDAGSPTDDGGGSSGGGSCQADGLTTCSAATCDDGTASAARLGAASLDCQFQLTSSNWATSMSNCADLGSGWRLVSKGEALKIASTPSVCRTPLQVGWSTWTRSCAEAGRAWYATYLNFQAQFDVNNNYFGLCVRDAGGGSTVDAGAGAPDAGRVDAGAPDAGRVDAGGTQLVCGRYQVIDQGTGASTSFPCPGAGCDGSGLVKDVSTGLTWARFQYGPTAETTTCCGPGWTGQTQARAASYCSSKGMRLPTKDEALAIATMGNARPCWDAWPLSWGTWTSTPGTIQQTAWWVRGLDGYTSADNILHTNNAVLCVR